MHLGLAQSRGQRHDGSIGRLGTICHRYRRDTISAGFYVAISKERAASKEKSGDRSRHVVASSTQAAYEFAATIGLVDDDALSTFGGDVGKRLLRGAKPL
eukprot:g5643.t1